MAVRPDAYRTGDLLRIRDERWRVTRWLPYDDAAVVEVAGQDRSNRGSQARFLLPFEPVERIHANPEPRLVSAARWRRVARAVLAEATPAWDSLRAPLRAELTIAAFQLEPALAVVSGACSRMLIADAVGLGKTVQAGLVIAELFARDADARAIVVCPSGLRDQWAGELRHRFALSPAVLDSVTVSRHAGLSDAGMNPWAAEPLILTSIDYLKRPEVMRALEPLLWDVAVFDEAHALGGSSDRATAAALLGTRSRHVVLLTATPHNGDDEIYRRMCAIGRLDDDDDGFVVFRRERTDAGIHSRRRSTRLHVRPSDVERLLHRQLAAYVDRVRAANVSPGATLAMSVLARRAASSPAALARSLERRIELLADAAAGGGQLSLPLFFDTESDAEPDVMLAARGLDDPAAERAVLQRLLRAAMDACRSESKLCVLDRLLRRVSEPAIVFTEYRDTLAHIAARVAPDAVQLHGGMSPADRRQSTRAFTEGRALLLLATDAASEGLNLHARCRLVINLELPWTPARLEQRIGRVDRIGQQRTVHAVTLLRRGLGEDMESQRFTIREERAHETMQRSRESSVTDAARATQEAVRLTTARTMLAQAASVTGVRPIACRVRRPNHPAATITAWRITFADAGDRVVWEQLCGVCAAQPRVAVAREALLTHAEQTRDALGLDMRGARERLLRREHAIVAAMRRRHARLAADLLQPGLFDARAARAAAAHSTVLQDALARSEARIRALERAESLRVDEQTLLFAIAFR